MAFFTRNLIADIYADREFLKINNELEPRKHGCGRKSRSRRSQLGLTAKKWFNFDTLKILFCLIN
ncbi:hypothetical protein AWB64_03475 [Caballeronia sordidicola]|uniref:Uncharacterized protein n=2 Tax=Caballeronia sordidicola TaxID=196367 RepID=A0A158GT15_CABSO|nr:hypothetical protein AWB64_03475 [Caballeronia sordidicola]